MTSPNALGRVELRAKDPDAALGFYGAVLSLDALDGALGRGGEPWLHVGALPAQAAARGAPPHWLTHVCVDDVDAWAERLASRGATRLGPTTRGPGDVVRAVLRDPTGAVMCVGAPSRPSPAVAFRVYRAHDVDVGFRFYEGAFGWARGDDLTAGVAREPGFAFSVAGGAPDGVAISNAASPGVHAQWLHCFRVADLDRALAEVRSRGGVTLPVSSLPSGARLASCDDPHGGAFGLWQDG